MMDRYRDDSLVLVCPYYRANGPERQRELDLCLANNVENRHLARIVLLIDDDATPSTESDRMTVIGLSERPTYQDWISLAESGRTDEIYILANSDIHFDDSIQRLPKLLSDEQTFMALSRWEVVEGKTERHPNPHWSQDTWAVRGGRPFPEEIKSRLDFRLGVPRCDNKVAYVFATAGWTVKNPQDLIRSYHLQESGERSYDKQADTTLIGGVAYVHATSDLRSASRLDFDIWTLGEPPVDQVSINTSLERWRKERRTERASTAQATGAEPKAPRHPLPPGERMLDLYRHGRVTRRDLAARFSIREGTDALLIQRGVDPKNWKVLRKEQLRQRDPDEHFPDLFGGVLDYQMPAIGDRPADDEDVNFWQYPCLTERQAHRNHLAASERKVRRDDSDRVDVYVALPWATYIDHRRFPENTLCAVRTQLTAAREIASVLGRSLRAHTVCQHIRWNLMMETAAEIGITDLWISHCTSEARETARSQASGMRLHPWSLYAVNYCDPDRRRGLEVGKPMSERRLLASFIGAQMPHYLSDIRARLHQALTVLQRDDILIDLGDTWHFNKTVYDHQIRRERLAEEHQSELEESAYRYNRVLSDSKFSLCPEGAGPNTLRLWESIAVGSIPVLFNDALELPYHFGDRLLEHCVIWREPSVGRELIEHLEHFEVDELQRRSDGLRSLYSDMEDMTCF